MLRMLPRAAILVTAIGELLSGDYLYGSFCLVALAIAMSDASGSHRAWP